MDNIETNKNIIQVPISKLSDKHANFRIISPSSEKAHIKLIQKFGIVKPLIVSPIINKESNYEIIDGFKRYRACKYLGINEVPVSVLDINNRVLKAGIIIFNNKSRSISDIEESMVVFSLYKNDNLTQVEIGTLLNKHKSWVCRRIALITRLEQQIINTLRLGLINISTCRELSRLPRGNQEKVMITIIEYNLKILEVKKLIDNLLEGYIINSNKIIELTEDIIENRANKSKQPQKKISNLYMFKQKLNVIEAIIVFLSKRTNQKYFEKFSNDDQNHLLNIIDKLIVLLNRLHDQFNKRNFEKQI